MPSSTCEWRNYEGKIHKGKLMASILWFLLFYDGNDHRLWSWRNSDNSLLLVHIPRNLFYRVAGRASIASYRLVTVTLKQQGHIPFRYCHTPWTYWCPSTTQNNSMPPSQWNSINPARAPIMSSGVSFCKLNPFSFLDGVVSSYPGNNCVFCFYWN